MKNKLLVISGPTASGKTALSIQLAKAFGGEIVGADSMQVYQGMDIGTAKPNEQEKEGVLHHLIDVVSPDETFSAPDYSVRAKQAINEILQRNHLPILVGGTGLYIQSVIDNVQYPPKTEDFEYCQMLGKIAREQGNEAVWEMLAQVDPDCANALHPNNVGRIIRGLEVYHSTGQTISQWQANSKLEPSPYDVLYLGLGVSNRDYLYQRINQRVHSMLEQGLLEELNDLIVSGFGATAAQAIGYKEFFGYLNGENTLEESIERVQRDSRRYAKRQLTWMRREKRIHWFMVDECNEEKLLQKTRELVSNWYHACQEDGT